jgi:hypothetical protein
LRYSGSSAGPDLLGRLRRAVRNLH